MKDVNILRILVIILCAVVFVAVLVFNALAGAGKGRWNIAVQEVSFTELEKD